MAAQDPADRVFDLLNDAQIGYEVKRRVHEAVRRDPVGALGQAPALGVEGPLRVPYRSLRFGTEWP